MTSRTNPPSQSKIPKLQSPSSPPSPRSRTPSFFQGGSTQNQSHKAPGSPRQPISFRSVPNPSASSPFSRQQASKSYNNVSSSIKSRSDGDSINKPSDFTKSLPNSMYKSPTEHYGQGEGDFPRISPQESQPRLGKQISNQEMENALTGLILPSTAPDEESPRPSNVSSQRNYVTSPSNTKDVSILYAPNPLRMESTSSVPPPLQHKKSPTYLSMYRKQKHFESQELQLSANETVSSLTSTKRGPLFSPGFETESSQTLASLGSLRHKSSGIETDGAMEWDFSGISGYNEKEISTQTSRTVVGTVDRGSSCIQMESCSKESLLENQTKPLEMILEQTTEQEESAEEDSSEEDDEYDFDDYVARSCDTVKVVSQNSPNVSTGRQSESVGLDQLTAASLQDSCGDITETEEDEQVYIERDQEPFFKAHVLNASSQRDLNNLSKHEHHYEHASEVKQVFRPNQHNVPTKRTMSNLAMQNKLLADNRMTNQWVKDDMKQETRQSATYTKLGGRHGVSAPSLQDWYVEKAVPKLNLSISRAAIEVQPSPAPLTLDELKLTDWPSEKNLDNEAGSAFSVKSTVILQQNNYGKSLKSSFELCNSTAFLQGYKILLNAAARKHLKICPSMGLIAPHGRTFVDITSKDNHYTTEVLAKFRIIVKMFRAYCDSNNLRDFYNGLEEQHPELIQTKIIDKVIIWKHDNLSEMLDTINSITDLREREVLKEELHRQFSENGIPASIRPSTQQQLSNLKLCMIIANQNFHNLYLELTHIRQIILLVVFMGFLMFTTSYVLPYLAEQAQDNEEVVMEVPPPEPEPEPIMEEDEEDMPFYKRFLRDYTFL